MGRPSKYLEHRDEIMQLIGRAQLTHGRSPSVRDLAESTGTGLATMHAYLGKLSDEGMILWQPRTHRSIRISPLGLQHLTSLGASSASASS